MCDHEGLRSTGWRALPDECWRNILGLACDQPAASAQQWRQLAQVCKVFYHTMQTLPVSLDLAGAPDSRHAQHRLRSLPPTQLFYGLLAYSVIGPPRLADLLRSVPALQRLCSLSLTLNDGRDLPMVAAACPASLVKLDLNASQGFHTPDADPVPLHWEGLATLTGITDLSLCLYNDVIPPELPTDLSVLTRLTRLRMDVGKLEDSWTPQLQVLPASLRNLEIRVDTDGLHECEPDHYTGLLSLATLPPALVNLEHLCLGCHEIDSHSLPAALPRSLTSVELHSVADLRLHECAPLLQLRSLRQLSCHVWAETDFEHGGTLHFALGAWPALQRLTLVNDSWLYEAEDADPTDDWFGDIIGSSFELHAPPVQVLLPRNLQHLKLKFKLNLGTEAKDLQHLRAVLMQDESDWVLRRCKNEACQQGEYELDADK